MIGVTFEDCREKRLRGCFRSFAPRSGPIIAGIEPYEIKTFRVRFGGGGER